MKKKTVSLSLALPLAFFAGTWSPVAAPPQAPDLTKVLAIVDMDEVRRSYPKAADLQEALKAETDRVRTEAKKRQEALEDQRMKLVNYDELTEARIEAEAKFAGAKAELEQWVKAQDDRLTKDRFEKLSEISEAIRTAVKSLAEKRGLQIVLHVRGVPENTRLSQRLDIQQLNDVIYHAPALDLTADVIKLMK